MNMIIHDMEGQIEIGDTFRNPKFRESNRLMAFDRVVANPMWNQTMFEEKDYDADAFGRFPNDAGYPGSKADWGWMQHILASLNEKGKAAVVFDTGAASRGSGNANSNKEKEIRKWFIENDLLDGVLYLPENLFYNMSAPGIILFINRSKSAEKKNKVFLVNASKECAKGDPKNYITEEGIEKISSAFLKWKEIEKFSRMVSKEEIAKNDYNISPSRYIYISDAEEYRPIGEIWEEIMELENDEASISEKLQIIINRIL